MKERVDRIKLFLGHQPMDYKTFNDTLGLIEELYAENQSLKTEIDFFQNIAIENQALKAELAENERIRKFAQQRIKELCVADSLCPNCQKE